MYTGEGTCTQYSELEAGYAMVYVLNTGSCTQKRVHVFNSVNCDQQKGTVSARNFTYVLVL